MEKIPLVQLKDRKIHLGNNENALNFDEFLEQSPNYDKIYFLDIDGIYDGRPNLCLYQRMPDDCTMWVDAGPRNLGDVVDIVMAGATNITARKKLWPDIDIASIRDVTELEIYFDINLENQNQYSIGFSPLNVDGLVLFNNKEEVEYDFKLRGLIKNLVSKHKMYVYDSNPYNYLYWEKNGFTGVLIDPSKIKEFK